MYRTRLDSTHAHLPRRDDDGRHRRDVSSVFFDDVELWFDESGRDDVTDARVVLRDASVTRAQQVATVFRCLVQQRPIVG